MLAVADGDQRGLFSSSGIAGSQGAAKQFERFTDRARPVVVRAQEEARTLDHDYVSSAGATRRAVGAHSVHPAGKGSAEAGAG